MLEIEFDSDIAESVTLTITNESMSNTSIDRLYSSHSKQNKIVTAHSSIRLLLLVQG